MRTARGSTRARPAWSSRASCASPDGRRALLAAGAVLLLCACGDPSGSGEAKASRPTRLEPSSYSAEGDSTLGEMRRRHVIGPDAVSWTPEQNTLLLRIREAQALGAFNLLRAKLGTLRGLATEFQSEDGYKRLWLTAEGYQRFIFLLSQDARAYFESRGAEARFVFELKTLGGKLLFTPDGFLTQDGIELYQRIRRPLPAFWRYPGGGVTGNVRPPPELLRPVAAAPATGSAAALKPAWEAPPAGPGEEGPQSPEVHALERVAALIRSGYVEISQEEVQAILQAAKVSGAQLEKESSLQVVRTGQKVFFLLSPSDPLMSFVQQRRAAVQPSTVPLPPAAPPAGAAPAPEGAPQGGAPAPAPK